MPAKRITQAPKFRLGRRTVKTLVAIPVFFLTVFLLLQGWAFLYKKKALTGAGNLYALSDNLDPQNLTSAQLQSVINDLGAMYPNDVFVDEQGNTFTLFQDVTITQGGKPISPSSDSDDSSDNGNASTPTPANDPSDDPSPPAPTPDPDDPDPNPDDPDPDDPDPPTPVPDPEELIWPSIGYELHVGDSSSDFVRGERDKIQALIKKYYPRLVEIYGLPDNAEKKYITIIYNTSADYFGFIPDLDAIVLRSASPWEVLTGFTASFYGDRWPLIPQTWRYGLVYNTVEYVTRGESEYNGRMGDMRERMTSAYEKFNVPEFPIWGGQVKYSFDPFYSVSRAFLAVAGFDKVYLSDNGSFKEINEALYDVPLDSNVWKDEQDLFDEISDAFPDIAGASPGKWYSNQHVLHQTQTNPLAILIMRVFGQIMLAPHMMATDENSMMVYSFRSHVTDDGITFVPKRQKYQFTLYDDDDQVVFTKEIEMATMGRAWVKTSEMEGLGMFAGSRYMAQVSTRDSEGHFAHFEGGLPEGLYGVVTNFGQGSVTATSGGTTETVVVENGAFAFSKSFFGTVRLEVLDYQGNVAVEKTILKNADRYFAKLISGIPSYPVPVLGPGTRGGGGSTCELDLTDWEKYEDEELGYAVSYPPTWSNYGQSITQEVKPGYSYYGEGKHWSDENYTTTVMTFFSTKDVVQLLDHYAKHNFIDVTVSTSDFAGMEGWRDQFKDSKNKALEPELTTFKGASAKKYTRTEEMPAGDYYKEIYYLKYGDKYYFIDFGVYITDDVREENEKTLACLLERFEFLGEDVTEAGGETKVFVSDILGFKINYPASFYAYEHTSLREPPPGGGEPVLSKTLVQFFEKPEGEGERIDIWRFTNPAGLSTEEYADTYRSSSVYTVSHWYTGGKDVVIVSGPEGNEYLISRGNYMYILFAQEGEDIQGVLRSMVPTFEFIGGPTPGPMGTNLTALTKCSAELLAKEWDECLSMPVENICGYTKYIYDGGQEQVRTEDYTTPCKYCSPFDSDGNRGLMGTEMIMLGYQEGFCY